MEKGKGEIQTPWGSYLGSSMVHRSITGPIGVGLSFDLNGSKMGCNVAFYG